MTLAPITATLIAGALYLAAAGPAAAECGKAETQTTLCDLMSRARCNVTRLTFADAEAPGGASCGRLEVLLPQAPVYPNLPELRCLVRGADAQVQFTATNYQPRAGLHSGAVVQASSSWQELRMSGTFRTLLSPSKVWLENTGPGPDLVLKCRLHGYY